MTFAKDAAATCRADGRCQYAIDHGAEGMGHCPPGKCCMPAPAPDEASTPGELNFAQRLRGNAGFLASNYNNLSAEEAQVVVRALESAADHVEAYLLRTTVEEMVNRFLGWPLPKTFSPDCGISFNGRKDDEWNKNRTWPTGTNLFTADEARQMFEYVLSTSQPADGASVAVAELMVPYDKARELARAAYQAGKDGAIFNDEMAVYDRCTTVSHALASQPQAAGQNAAQEVDPYKERYGRSGFDLLRTDYQPPSAPDAGAVALVDKLCKYADSFSPNRLIPLHRHEIAEIVAALRSQPAREADKLLAEVVRHLNGEEQFEIRIGEQRDDAERRYGTDLFKRVDAYLALRGAGERA